MAVTTLRITDGTFPIDFFYSKSIQRLTSVAYHRLKNPKFAIGGKVTATVNPYSYTEAARPEERKSLTDFLVEAGDFFSSDFGSTPNRIFR